jgi:hypothetical protein
VPRRFQAWCVEELVRLCATPKAPGVSPCWASAGTPCANQMLPGNGRCQWLARPAARVVPVLVSSVTGLWAPGHRLPGRETCEGSEPDIPLLDPDATTTKPCCLGCQCVCLSLRPSPVERCVAVGRMCPRKFTCWKCSPQIPLLLCRQDLREGIKNCMRPQVSPQKDWWLCTWNRDLSGHKSSLLPCDSSPRCPHHIVTQQAGSR